MKWFNTSSHAAWMKRLLDIRGVLGTMLLISHVAAQSTIAATDLEEVVVTASRPDNPREPSVQTAKLLSIPASFGDPLQTIFALPGVVQPNEGTSNPAVRGSGPQDNVFLVDNLPTAALFHPVMGNSIFAEDLIHDFGLHAAGFGAEYGGATGAVFDIALREPRAQRIRTTVEASFLRVGVLLEGSLSARQRFYFSGRESLVHLFLPIMQKEQNKKDDIDVTQWPRSRDLVAKYVWEPVTDHQIVALATAAQDTVSARFGSNSDVAQIDPGSTGDASITTRFNSIGTRWNFRPDSELQGWHTNAAVSQLDSSTRMERGSGNEYADIGFKELNIKAQLALTLTAQQWQVGIEQQNQRLTYIVHSRYRSCTEYSPECATDPGVWTDADDSARISISSMFTSNRIQLTSKWSITPGIRYSHNNYLHETHIEPRVTSELVVSDQWSVHGAWGNYHQAPEVVQQLPVFGNPALNSPTATHYLAGIKHQLADGWWWNSDVYYKTMRQLVVDVSDARKFTNGAEGKAYGAELMINKDLTKRWSGWMTLALSRTQRHQLAKDITARFDYDTPVVANLVVNYQLGRRWTAGARWNYRSGFPYTAIIGNTANPNYPGYYLPVYGSLNGERASAYHRLDLHLERPFGRSNRFNGSWFVDVINLYNRRNGGSVEYKPVAGTSDYTLEERDSLPLIPSVGIKLTF